MDARLYTAALLDSLVEAPLFLGDLPEAAVFDRAHFSEIPQGQELQFQQKLGHLYEDALEILLRHSPSVEVLGKSLQVREPLPSGGELTLGELDFLLWDKFAKQHVQLELAVKFYLAFEHEGEVLYPGPDPRDQWGAKLRRMREHQFIIARGAPAQAMLKEQYGVSSLEVQQLVYGCVFDHIAAADLSHPPAVGARCRRGKWLSVSEWTQHFTEDEVKIIPKCLWPVQVSEDLLDELTCVSSEELRQRASERCVMWMRFGDATPYFLVPDHWREHVLSSLG